MIRSLIKGGCLAAMLVLAMPASAQDSPLQPPHITVDGRAQEMVEPDALRIVAGVETQKASHTDAMSENAKVVARVIDAAKQMGVAASDVRTSRIDLHADYNNSSSGPKAPSFRAVNLVTVTMRNVKDADRLVGALISAGANRIQGVAPIVERNDGRSARLREKAIANAREIAEQSAKAAGAKLGPILRILATTEDSSGVQPVAYRGGAGSVPIEEGTVPVSISVNMTWGIAP